MSAGDDSCGHEGCGCQESGPVTPGDAEASILDQLDNETGFHPMGEEWESEMREMLDETDYDADLGMDMARDAMRLVSGELSEEEFYEEYHEAVVDEFEIDDRPMAELFDEETGEPKPGMAESLKEMADTDVSRRQTMKKGAFAAGALGLGGLVPTGADEDDEPSGPSSSVASAQGDGDDGKRLGMVIDLDRCDGCLQCVIGCMDEHRTDSGANWMYVLTYQQEDTDQNNFLVRPCQHCTNAPCAKVCPVMARHVREEDGIVLTNYETCIGCRYCQVACPYGVNYFGWGHPEVPREELDTVDYTGSELRDMSEEERLDILQDSGDQVHDKRGWEVGSRNRIGTMGKCTFNVHRQDGNMGEELEETTACMEACDTAGMSAIHFGDLNDENSRPNQYLELREEIEPDTAEKQERLDDVEEEWQDPPAPHQTQQLSAFRLLEDIGTEPNIIYLGNEPGPNAEQLPDEEQPVSYDRISASDGRDITNVRKDVTDEYTDFGAMEQG